MSASKVMANFQDAIINSLNRQRYRFHVDEERLSFAKRDELNSDQSETLRERMEEHELPSEPGELESAQAQPGLGDTCHITTWEAGWNVTNAIQVGLKARFAFRYKRADMYFQQKYL